MNTSGAAGSLPRVFPTQKFLTACAWGVHLYTALGAALGLLAIFFASRGDFRASFLAMGAATIIDCSDGPLARWLMVKIRVPTFDGALLDNIVDYLTYTVAPVFLMLEAGIIPDSRWGLALACFVMLASVYGFCHTEAKTPDHYFLGFPNYWNLVAFYLYCLGSSTVVQRRRAFDSRRDGVHAAQVHLSKSNRAAAADHAHAWSHLGIFDGRVAADAADCESDHVVGRSELHRLLLHCFVHSSRAICAPVQSSGVDLMAESELHTAAVASESWLEVIDSDSPLLLIAPHGGRAEPRTRSMLNPKVNDLHTAEITRGLAARLGASALINVAMDRNRLDCNRLSQIIERAPWLLELIAERVDAIVARHGRVTVLLIHGWNIIEPRLDFGLGLRTFGRRIASARFRLRLCLRRFYQWPPRRPRRAPASAWNQADLRHALSGRRFAESAAGLHRASSAKSERRASLDFRNCDARHRRCGPTRIVGRAEDAR